MFYAHVTSFKGHHYNGTLWQRRISMRARTVEGEGARMFSNSGSFDVVPAHNASATMRRRHRQKSGYYVASTYIIPLKQNARMFPFCFVHAQSSLSIQLLAEPARLLK